MDIVVTKWIALEATALLAREKEEELKVRFPEAMIRDGKEQGRLLTVDKEEEIARGLGITSLIPLENGGIFTGLWRLGERLEAGMEIELRKIPIRQETVEICEFFGLNPYNIASKGSLLIAAENSQSLLRELKKADIPGTVIGYLNKSNDRIIWNGENKRFLDRPQKEELYKIWKKGWEQV